MKITENVSTNPKTPRKLKNLSNKDRLNVATLVSDRKYSVASIANQYGVSWDSVSRATKRKHSLKYGIEQGIINPDFKRQRKCKCPILEEKLFQWIEIIRIWKLPLTKSIIQTKAIEIYNKLIEEEKEGKEEKEEEKHEKSKDFKASDGWFDGFKKRYKLRSCKLSGESASSEVNKYRQELQMIKDEIGKFDPDDVYNMDETGLFYKMLPDRTYCLECETNPHGSKQQKDRITVILCCNLSGTHKIPVAVIGSSKKPHCFNRSRPPIPYFNSPKAWINKEIYHNWFTTIFVPSIRQKTDRPVLLILDNCSVHQVIEAEGITTIFLPPNVTSTSQPLDQGIICAVKKNYRTNVLKKVMQNMDMFIQNSEKSRKRSGLHEGGLPDVLDASIVLKESWENIPPKTIIKSWVHSNLVPEPIVAELKSLLDTEANNKENIAENKEIENLSEKFAIIHLKHFENESKQEDTIVYKQNIEKWIQGDIDQKLIMESADEQLWDIPRDEQQQQEQEQEQEETQVVEKQSIEYQDVQSINNIQSDNSHNSIEFSCLNSACQVIQQIVEYQDILQLFPNIEFLNCFKQGLGILQEYAAKQDEEKDMNEQRI